ncbi:MAG: 50S ribosomal protein L2 [bacterium]|nr:50S ribosomal protein L2 [bacterium]
MAIKSYKKNTSARRNMSVLDFSKVTKKTPEKSLTVAGKQKSGRNNQGRITVRHRGGGAKRKTRIIDFQFTGKEVSVKAIEYDPNRSANIALVETENKKKAYVLATLGLKVGQKVSSSQGSEVRAGNRKKLKDIPVGLTICNIELNVGRGAQLVRSAGAKARLAAKEGEYAHIKLPSSEVRLVNLECYATIGQIGNLDHQNVKIGSAGRKRKMGIRPTVRGKAMNPRDHAHGGGEGASPIGLKHPKTPWGKPALGYRTRRRKSTNQMIVRRRKKR